MIKNLKICILLIILNSSISLYQKMEFELTRLKNNEFNLNFKVSEYNDSKNSEATLKNIFSKSISELTYNSTIPTHQEILKETNFFEKYNIYTKDTPNSEYILNQELIFNQRKNSSFKNDFHSEKKFYDLSYKCIPISVEVVINQHTIVDMAKELVLNIYCKPKDDLLI